MRSAENLTFALVCDGPGLRFVPWLQGVAGAGIGRRLRRGEMFGYRSVGREASRSLQNGGLLMLVNSKR